MHLLHPAVELCLSRKITSHPMTHAIVLGSLTAATIIGGFIESRLHRQRLARIPHRIHVNGTRGKSSVARLIADYC